MRVLLRPTQLPGIVPGPVVLHRPQLSHSPLAFVASIRAAPPNEKQTRLHQHRDLDRAGVLVKRGGKGIGDAVERIGVRDQLSDEIAVLVQQQDRLLVVRARAGMVIAEGADDGQLVEEDAPGVDLLGRRVHADQRDRPAHGDNIDRLLQRWRRSTDRFNHDVPAHRRCR